MIHQSRFMCKIFRQRKTSAEWHSPKFLTKAKRPFVVSTRARLSGVNCIIAGNATPRVPTICRKTGKTKNTLRRLLGRSVLPLFGSERPIFAEKICFAASSAKDKGGDQRLRLRFFELQINLCNM